MRAAPILVTLGIFLSPAIAQAQIKAETNPEGAIKTDTKLGLANRFSITIDGVVIASFAEASINARTKPPTVVLKRGKNNSMELWAWHEAARTGEMSGARKSASLVMYNYDGKPVARYDLVNAWAVQHREPPPGVGCRRGGRRDARARARGLPGDGHDRRREDRAGLAVAV